MSIEITYKELILEDIIQELLLAGTSPTVSRITSNFNTYVTDHDLTKPLFSYDDYKVGYGSTSSAALFTATNNTIYKDLKVLYRHMLQQSEQTIINFDRWRSEAWLLDGQMNSLLSRINSLLLIAQDTTGYLNYLQDDFVDTSKTELASTTAYVNTAKQYLTIGTTTAGVTRIDLSSLLDTAVEFNVLTKNNLVSVMPAAGSTLVHAFNDINNFWQDRVYMSKPVTVTAELRLDFGLVKTFSRIDVDLHMSNSANSVQFTPMYSIDNFTWMNLPTDNFTASINENYTFQFTAVSARYVKFIMTKQGSDLVHKDMYVYEFGADEISFYSEGFTADAEVTFISKPLSVTDQSTSLPQKFSKIVLETCERIPIDTSIDFFATVSDDATVPISAQDVWVAIDPSNRTNPKNPTSLDFGNLSAITMTGITPSYSALATDTKFRNPAQVFTYVSGTVGTTATEVACTSSSQRYTFRNSNERILDHELASSIEIAAGTLEVWRNVKVSGSTNKVRDVANGWGFNDPWYTCVVFVQNPNGVEIDFGPKAIVLDGEPKTGKISISYGRHSLRTHKDNWKEFSATGITTLAQLKAADALYPYNHRYLIEAFPYPVGWATTEEKVYTGFEIVAEFFMKEVSPFDLISNVKATDYEHFALDLSAPDVGSAGYTTKPAARVFLVKCNEENSDFTNEQYLVKFKSVDTLYQYLRLKAVLKTKDTTVAPYIDSYRIKLAS
jgi:hypothetical protein